MSLPQRIIVTRFSAMGDVAMVASVLKEFCIRYPDVEIIMVSRPFFSPFFDGIKNLRFHVIEPKTIHKGFWGLFRLNKELAQYCPDAVADLHFNLRSRVLDLFFSLSGVKVKQLDKGREEKKALTREKNKIKVPLRLTVERYADVFRALGFKFELSHKLVPNLQDVPKAAFSMFANFDRKKIGIAPFAQHRYKILSLVKMGQIIDHLTHHGYDVLLFGGGQEEFQVAQNWTESFPNTYNTIGKFTLREELDLISNLDLMVSMDSSGLHMASLMGVRCLSLWGATHPYAGFTGYGQELADCIQVEHPHRPSSVYGNKSCICDGVEAIDLITPEMVIERINGIR
ncbi:MULTISPECIES: glycosyltransferase family 9 protein [unclassified Sphingobacterium]|uniref:glycosyltransferase family 9 protein n=1 Tax=unclassified Sphingobacterium TaxID=2609468 RepID=UPI0025D35583|nr:MULTISPECIES: glycosyltransferase family 9 protein [unclassified Sphingobacterium]